MHKFRIKIKLYRDLNFFNIKKSRTRIDESIKLKILNKSKSIFCFPIDVFIFEKKIFYVLLIFGQLYTVGTEQSSLCFCFRT
jgi:hypothetical protein